jgi:hypothetical protein
MSDQNTTYLWDLLRVAREVVDDYAERTCDDLDRCECSMARLKRLALPEHDGWHRYLVGPPPAAGAWASAR